MEARRDGNIPFSTEATLSLIYLFMALGLLGIGGYVVQSVGTGLVGTFLHPDDLAATFFHSEQNNGLLGWALMSTLPGIAPLYLLPILAILLSVIAQNALVFAPKRLKWQLSKVSPIANAKKKYGPSGLFEFLKTTLKLSLVIGLVTLGALWKFPSIFTLMMVDIHQSLKTMAFWAISTVGIFAFSSLLVTVIDLPWQFAQNRKKLRMTFKELKDEAKKNEGDPHLKQARRERAQELANNQGMKDVPGADVIIVNPLHYAVALKWSRKRNMAPICVAKGVDLVAARIREIAAENGVPIHRDPPTARSIHARVDVGQEIQLEHYAAVASAIHFAENVRRKAKATYG